MSHLRDKPDFAMMLLRSHKDLVKDAAPHYKKARKFYDGLAAQLVQQGHALDVFACSLDQVSVALQCSNSNNSSATVCS